MYNDFVLIGPKSDPAGIKGIKDVAKALQTIKDKQAPVHFTRRPLRHPYRRTRALEGCRHRHRKGQGPLVQGDRPGHGRRAQHRGGEQRLCAVRPRHLDQFQEQGRSCRSLVEGDKRLFNQYGVMLVNPGEASERQEGAGPAVHRLSDLAGGTEGHRQLQDQRRAVVLSECQRPGSVTGASTAQFWGRGSGAGQHRTG